jgi:RiboL-PSP-HEPN
MATTPPSRAHPLLDRALQQFSERVDRLRQDLYYCDIAALSPSRRELRTNVLAGSYVWLAAALEATMQGVLVGVLTEVNSATLSLQELRLSLFALAHAPQFDSLQELRGLRMWRSRAALFSEIQSNAACSLSLDKLPLDGRTIRSESLDAIWQVFGFSGDPTPGPLHRLALNDLAETRNEVAHGDEEASVIAGRKSMQDLLRFIDRIEEIALHIWTTTDNYLDRQDYRR